jgi:competence protein ComEC
MTPLVYAGSAWVAGIWLSSLLAFPPQVWAGVAVASLLLTALARSKETRFLFGCAVVLALGGVRLTLAQARFEDHSLVAFNDKGSATLVGVVAAEPDVRDEFVIYKLDVKSLSSDAVAGEPLNVHGAARITGPRYPTYAYGDRLQVYGSLETPPILKDFNYRDYLAQRGIHSQVRFAQIERLSSGGGSLWKRVMLDLKQRAQTTIGRILPEPEASLLAGILLGSEGGILPELKADFKATGTSHVIAISGFKNFLTQTAQPQSHPGHPRS